MTNKERYIAIFTFVCIIAAFQQSIEANSPSLHDEEIISTILKKESDRYLDYKTLRVNFVLDIINSEQKVTEKGNIIWGQNNEYDLEIGDSRVVTDGIIKWSYSKELNEVTIFEYHNDDDDEYTLSRIKSILTSPLEWLTPISYESKREFHIIELEPYEDNPDEKDIPARTNMVTLYISKKSNTISQCKIELSDNTLYHFYLKSINVQKEDSKDKEEHTFKFDTDATTGIKINDIR